MNVFIRVVCTSWCAQIVAQTVGMYLCIIHKVRRANSVVKAVPVVDLEVIEGIYLELPHLSGDKVL